MKLTHKFVLENLGSDFKNVNHSRIRLITFVDERIIGQVDGAAVVSGPTELMTKIMNSEMSIADYMDSIK